MVRSSPSPALQLSDIPLDTRSLPQERLNIKAKVRSNLFPWNGQFSPQLVHALLETYGEEDHLVLDPFMGSGTVLIEAARLRQRAFGSEINPAAYTMAQTYRLVNQPPSDRRRIIDRLDAALQTSFGDTSLFSQPTTGTQTDLRERLIELRDEQTASSPARQLIEALIVLVDFYKPDLSAERVLTAWRRLSNTVLELPYSDRIIDLANCDARQLPVSSGEVDLVVTSPPYINVFNYHQQYRASVEALGWDLLHVARSEMGANRKHRQNRFLTVTQYCLDICQALQEMRRVAKPTARLIIVVGRESNVLKTRFPNGDLVSRIGVRCVGLTAEVRQERVFKNKFGTMIYEDIIHFRLGGSSQTAAESPGTIASEALAAALAYCPDASRADLQDALERVPQVQPSAMYRPAPAEGKERP